MAVYEKLWPREKDRDAISTHVAAPETEVDSERAYRRLRL